jgi:hypothetical protein
VTETLDYEPAESRTGLFGGNSNWRGPVWFPLNYLLIETLRVYDRFLGDGFRVQCPTAGGDEMTLGEVADDLADRLIGLFRRPDRLDRAGGQPHPVARGELSVSPVTPGELSVAPRAAPARLRPS